MTYVNSKYAKLVSYHRSTDDAVIQFNARSRQLVAYDDGDSDDGDKNLMSDKIFGNNYQHWNDGKKMEPGRKDIGIGLNDFVRGKKIEGKSAEKKVEQKKGQNGLSKTEIQKIERAERARKRAEKMDRAHEGKEDGPREEAFKNQPYPKEKPQPRKKSSIRSQASIEEKQLQEAIEASLRDQKNQPQNQKPKIAPLKKPDSHSLQANNYPTHSEYTNNFSGRSKYEGNINMIQQKYCKENHLSIPSEASVGKSSNRTVNSSRNTQKSVKSKKSVVSKEINLLCSTAKMKNIVKNYYHHQTPDKQKAKVDKNQKNAGKPSKSSDKKVNRTFEQDVDEFESSKEEMMVAAITSSQKKADKLAKTGPYAPPRNITPLKQYPPLSLFYWNPNSLGTLQQGNPSIKRELIEAEDCHFVFLVEPYHHYELPGYNTKSGTPLKDKKKIYAQVLWRKELPVEVFLADVDLIVLKMDIPYLTNPLYLFCVYLSHTDSRRLHCLTQIKDTLDQLTKAAPTPETRPLVILVGDFNKNLLSLNPYSRDPCEKLLNYLTRQFIAALDMKHNDITRERVILNGKKIERSRIDWMLMSKYGVKVQSSVVKDSMQWSDHFAFVFKIDV